jgi:hypothetical protein
MLVVQYRHPGNKALSVEPFIFRYYACPTCRGVHNRSPKNKTKWHPIPWLPDEEVL